MEKFDKEEFCRNRAILMLADMPDKANDGDPVLISKMDAIYSHYFLDYQSAFSGKTIIERLTGCEFEVPEIEMLELNCIEKQEKELTCFDIDKLSMHNICKVKRYLNFLKDKKISLSKLGSVITGISEIQLRKIFNKYGSEFDGEKIEVWLKRFEYPNRTAVKPIDIKANTTNYSNRLTLYAILSSIQKNTGGEFNFENFVDERFGVKNFQKVKTTNKDKDKFKRIERECDAIIRENASI